MFSSSSARTPSGKFDHDSAASAADAEREGPRYGRFGIGASVRSSKDLDKDRADHLTTRGDHTKRGFGRDDGEGWTSVSSRQPRRSFGAEDGDRFRRNGDRPKRETPWDKDRPPKYDSFSREREHRPRGRRDEASWLLDDRGGDRESHRERDHQRYNSKSEKDPEWMDSGPENEDKTGDAKTAHSMEEFQRWKERMKANSGQEEKRNKSESPVEHVEQVPSPTDPKDDIPDPLEAEAFSFSAQGILKVSGHETFVYTDFNGIVPETTPAVVENGVDRFFGLWGTPVPGKSPEQDIFGNARPETKPVAKSRFTSFFAPQEPVSPVTPGTPTVPKAPTPSNESSSEDKEGFQRILKILSETSVGSLGPVSAPPPPMSSYLPQPSVSPMAVNAMSPHPPPPYSQHGQLNSPPPQRDPNADFLMRLMHQSHQSQQNQGPPPPPPLHIPYAGPSQMPPPPPISTSPHGFQPAKNNPLPPAFDDPAITAFRQRSNQDSTSPVLPRGSSLMEQHGLLGGWNLQQAQQLSQQQPLPQPHRQVAPPPGFAGPQRQHHHHQGPPPPPPFLGPPPGISGQAPMPFQLGPPPPNMPPSFPLPPPFFGPNNHPLQMNGMNGLPPPGYHMQFHPHHEPLGPPIGMHGPPFGYPHEVVKNPQHPHGPNNPRFPNEPIHRQIR